VKKLVYRLLFALPLLALAGLPVSADTPPPMSATVIMTDTGFNPAAVTIQPGGTVTWINQGQQIHTATTIGGAPLPFNTGGLSTGQSASSSLGIPGKYYYTSATDCQGGIFYPNFPCQISFLINVTSASAEATSAAATAVSLPVTPTPTATLVPSNLPPPIATVNISDTGITPSSVTIALNGSVLFVNQGQNVHTATAPGNTTWPGFDTGGLGRGQISSIGFAQAGTFTYTSAVDCTNGNKTAGFDCGPFSVVVSPVALPALPNAAPTVAPTAVRPLAAPNPNTTVGIDDAGGFTPNALTIKAGQSITWVNRGTGVHTVTSDAGYTPSFDSGGLNQNQSFTVTFASPGSFGYHSQTDVTYFTDAGCGCTAANFAFKGLINVTP